MTTAQRQRLLLAAAIFSGTVASGCGGRDARPVLRADDTSLHLEDRLADAAIEGSEAPPEDRATLAWTFDTPTDAWRPLNASVPHHTAPVMRREAGALRVEIGARNTWVLGEWRMTRALLYAPVPNLDRVDWGALVVRARVDGNVRLVHPFFNVRANAPRNDPLRLRADSVGRSTPLWATLPVLGFSPEVSLARDSTVQTYRMSIPLRTSNPRDPQWVGPIREIGLVVGSNTVDPPDGRIDLLSVTLERRGADFADSAAGLREVDREGVLRPVVYTHAPSRLRWRVRVPEGARLGVALATHDRRSPVRFTVTVSSRSADTTVFQETVTDETTWHERAIDLSAFAGRTVDLILGTGSGRPGQIGFWGSPILSGTARTSASRSRPPNVIVYVIDGGGADLMSLYGYNRHTTPNLERLAAEGVVFDRAHSNSAWTKPSTASFMTGLQHSALGGFRDWGDRIPEAAPTMGQRFHAAGYQTAWFTFNGNAGRGSALNRGVDRFQDNNRPGQRFAESARFLQEAFWGWREAFPGSPWWAHFQVTDVHEPQITLPPFQGLFVDAARRERLMGHPPAGDFETGDGWFQRVQRAPGWSRAERGEMSLAAHYRETLAQLGIDRIEFYDIQRGLYDETMVRVDHHLGRFVDRLKATGEWDNTILVVTADHGHPAGSHTRFGRELFDPVPAETEGAFFDSYRTRVPLVIVAPGRLPAGVRIREPVSLVDLLPTVLDLAGLPPPERTQGRSLVPLMRGDPSWETRPVILEQVERDVRTDEWTGHIEMIDGRWGASLEIWPQRGLGDPPVQPSRWESKARFHVDGQPRLLLYDLWEDPFTRQNVNARYPELVERYTRLLETQWRAHLAMAALYKPGGQVQLTAAQLETLRALGYIR